MTEVNMITFGRGYRGYPPTFTKENVDAMKNVLKRQVPAGVYDAFDRVLLGIKHSLPQENYAKDYALLATLHDQISFHVMEDICWLYTADNLFLKGIEAAKKKLREEQQLNNNIQTI